MAQKPILKEMGFKSAVVLSVRFDSATFKGHRQSTETEAFDDLYHGGPGNLPAESTLSFN